MKRLLTLSLFIIFMGFVPISCGCFTSCGCNGGGGGGDFEISQLNIFMSDIDGQRVTGVETYGHDSVFFVLTLNENSIAKLENKQTGSFFSNMAYACDPLPPSARQQYASITINTVNSTKLINENDILEAGQDISARFMGAYYLSDFFQFISTMQHGALYSDTKLYIRLAEKPYQPVDLLLDITVTMTDGDVYEFKNQIVRVR